MAAPAILKILLSMDSKDAAKGLDQVADKSQKTGSSIKKIAGAVATGFAVTKVVEFGKKSFQAAQESEVAGRRLETVFKSMGDTTGTAAAAAESYAGSLSKKIGVDDEEIQAGQAMLATFGDVSNATARQAGIFDRATAAGADLAAAGFGSISSNAVQLGKALQDPTKGITALAKSGVTFTDQQKAQIAAMQKSGDLLGAQKIVLGAVEKQVKGTAEATATGGAKMAVAMDGLQETIGAALLPVVNTLTDKLTGLISFISANASWLVPVIAGVALFALTIKGVTLATEAYTAIQSAARTATIVWAAAQRLLNITFLGFPLVWIIAAVIAVVAIIVILYTKCAWFRDAVAAVWGAIKAVFQAAANVIIGIVRWLVANIGTILKVISVVLFGPFAVAFLLLNRFFPGWIGTLFGWFTRIPGQIASALANVSHAISAPFIAGFQIIKDAVGAVVDWVGEKLGGIGRVIGDVVGRVKDIWNSFARVWNSVNVSYTVNKAIPIIGGKTIGIDLPDVPTFARGSYVKSATLALVGEGRGGEFVAPEAMLRRAIREESGAGGVIQVIVPPTANPAEVGRVVVDSIRAFERAAGRSWRTG